jgi:RNA polymerase sigma-70 factor (ECF subfamily)
MRCTYPRVARWEETDDILQNAMLRLCAALEKGEPENARHFFRLAALQIRRELLDLASGFEKTNEGHATNADPGSGGDSERPDRILDRPDSAFGPDISIEWTEFHQRVSELDHELREVFDLLWYLGLKQREAAELLGVDIKTVQRRWRNARLALHDAVPGRSHGTTGDSGQVT